MLRGENEKSVDHVWRGNKATFPRPLATETSGLEIYRRKSKSVRKVIEQYKKNGTYFRTENLPHVMLKYTYDISDLLPTSLCSVKLRGEEHSFLLLSSISLHKYYLGEFQQTTK
jgi:hypothetical protein